MAAKKGAKKRSKKKHVSTTSLVEKAAKLLQKLRRMEMADDNGYCTCVSCGRREHYKSMDGGHFIPRGKHATKLEETNIHPQCKPCNGFGMKHGDAEKNYTLWMIDWYGREYVNQLLIRSRKPHKWYRPEVLDLIEEYKERIAEQEDRLL